MPTTTCDGRRGPPPQAAFSPRTQMVTCTRSGNPSWISGPGRWRPRTCTGPSRSPGRRPRIAAPNRPRTVLDTWRHSANSVRRAFRAGDVIGIHRRGHFRGRGNERWRLYAENHSVLPPLVPGFVFISLLDLPSKRIRTIDHL